MTYYAQRKSIKNENVTFNNRTGEKKEMLRQYFLYCAASATNVDGNDYDYVEYGTIERGPTKNEMFKQEPAPAPEPVAEGEGE